MHRLSILRPIISYSRRQAPVFIKKTISPILLSRQQQQPFSTFGSLYTKQDIDNNNNNKVTEENEDDILEEEGEEILDPKDYPELYPDEQDEEIDTEWFVDKEFISEEDFIPLWQKQATEKKDHFLKEDSTRQQLKAVSEQLIQDNGILSPTTIEQLLTKLKMDKIEILDIRDKCDWTSYMIIAESSKGDRFLNNVAEQFTSTVRKAIMAANHPQLPSPHIEGRNDDSGWLLIDLGHCVIHLFTPEVREKYDIEGLWKSVPNDPSLPMPEQ
ncbi:Oligomerization domain-containing protein [Cunninghamella echinulata]|nr:Oligomerization domain-containing protein [Cunninghamella echinulata]